MNPVARGNASKSSNGQAPVRDRSSILACVALLAAPWILPDGDLLRSALGRPRLDGELRHMATRGYYEELIDANRAPAPRPVGEAAPPAGWVPFGASDLVEPIPSYLRWRMRPGLDVAWNGESFRTNSRGYRTPEVAIPKPEGVYRIVLFGSSNTMGHGVGDDDAYPRLLERWLNEAVAPGRRVEVVNLSVSGDSPSRRLVRMREEAEAYQPDWVLCDATVLDPALEEAHLESVARGDSPMPIPPPLDYVRDALERAGVSPGDSADAFRSRIQGQARPLLEGAFAGWGDFARRTGLPLAIVLIPRADEKRDNPEIFKIIRASIRRERLDLLDAAEAFQGLSVEQFRVSPWDKHPSVLGHRAIFETLRAALADRGSLPGLELAR
ncbi:SGNH/GDSL hydrolase family protein [Planctomyces sp. SH-PL62]|uniref:SGNH/GDSL hydrolase family protein n=1 Tax=Planctomyces sp. SH-PL62 TaxID=1636152 RepID=UPI00078CB9DE|nr:GDSL-type esterase/lipase family protein [Planctomyces sp. SH-PL62]AMV38194.1 hypothetical protein VT85_12205 [Planctomyces sp. SH-PL62]